MPTAFAVGRVFGAVAVLMAGTVAGSLIGSRMDHFAAAGLPERGWLAFRRQQSGFCNNHAVGF
jgi:hypothetical protein